MLHQTVGGVTEVAMITKMWHSASNIEFDIIVRLWKRIEFGQIPWSAERSLFCLHYMITHAFIVHLQS